MKILIFVLLFPFVTFSQYTAKDTNRLVRMDTLKTWGFTLKGTAPANSAKVVNKREVIDNFYVDTTGLIGTYTNNRVVPSRAIVKSAFVKPSAPFYQYDVTRSSIPGATGAYFNYIGTDNASHQVLQNTYGYVGRFCMQDVSWRNNQYNVYTFTYVGLCYATPSTTYPIPINPQNRNTSLTFTTVSGYVVSDIKLYYYTQVTHFGTLKDFLQATFAAFTFQSYDGLEWTNLYIWGQSGTYTNSSSPAFTTMAQAPVNGNYTVVFTVKTTGGTIIGTYTMTFEVNG